MFLANLYLPLRDLLLLCCTFFSSSLLLLFFFFATVAHFSLLPVLLPRPNWPCPSHDQNTANACARTAPVTALRCNGTPDWKNNIRPIRRISLRYRPHRASSYHTTRSWVQIKFLTVLDTAYSSSDFDNVRGGKISNFKFREGLCRQRNCESNVKIFSIDILDLLPPHKRLVHANTVKCPFTRSYRFYTVEFCHDGAVLEIKKILNRNVNKVNTIHVFLFFTIKYIISGRSIFFSFLLINQFATSFWWSQKWHTACYNN